MNKNIKYIIIGIILLLFPVIVDKVITVIARATIYMVNAIQAGFAVKMAGLESLDFYIFKTLLVISTLVFFIAFGTAKSWLTAIKAYIVLAVNWLLILFFAPLFRIFMVQFMVPQGLTLILPLTILIWCTEKAILINLLLVTWTFLFPSLREKIKEQIGEKMPEQMNNKTMNIEAVDLKAKTAGEKE